MEGFYGTVSLQADEKGRYRIPSKYRSKFGEGKIFYMKNASRYLSIISEEKANEIMLKLSGKSKMSDIHTVGAARQIFKNMSDIKEDGQGRFTLPSEMKTELKLGKEVVFVGMGSKIELWGKENWDEENKKYADAESFDALIALLGEEITF
ncbi:MAG: division/cell wall cluster transcriptional repressor MraZ [Christensenellales bacterium]